MKFLARCDRCGVEQEVNPHGSTLTTGQPVDYRVTAPEGWTELRQIPLGGGGRQTFILCFGCVNALEDFFTGDGKVAGLLEPESLEQAEAEQAGGHGLLTADELVTAGQKEILRRYAEHNPHTPSWAIQGDGAEAELKPVCAVTGVHTSAPGQGGVCQHCGANYYDLSSAAGLPDVTGPLAGLQETQGMPVVLPVGERMAPCPYTDDTGRCDGTYERGQLHRHMKERHGVTVSPKSEACERCGAVVPVSQMPRHECGTVVAETGAEPEE